MDNIKSALIDGSLIPFIGNGVFYHTKDSQGNQMPYDSNSLSLAINSGRAMSERLMYEYTRTAMTIEQRRGRDYIVQMMNHIYSVDYQLPQVYELLKETKPKYVIDVTMDDSLQKVYADVDHTLIIGTSRLGAEYDRFLLYTYVASTQTYTRITQEEFELGGTILFKPMGSNVPELSYIVSDADFVDWLTEAMGGYALPQKLKEYRKDKSYLFMGVDFSKDTFRMVAHELTYDLGDSYWVNDASELTKSENRFVKNHNTTLIESDLDEFLSSLS
jgi:hypothetical protein